MKIAIITFHAAANHGAALQAFALQTYLQKLGHDTFFINYQLGGGIPRRGLLRWIGRTPATTIEKIHHQLRMMPFIRFQKANLKIGDRYYLDNIQLQNDPPIADAFICGSDQIWNPRFIKKEMDEHAYWLDFVSLGHRCIAYAASFGVNELDSEVQLRYSDYAKKFFSIGVREKDSVSLMQKLGYKNAVWVPDPTLLLHSSEYDVIEKKDNTRKSKYIFSYILGGDNGQLSLLVKGFVSGFFNVKCFEGYRKSLIDTVLHNGYICPGEWLGNLRDSVFVVTNSFHGVVFSILFKKLFVVLMREGVESGMNSRVNSLLEVVELQYRAISSYDEGYIKRLCEGNIDWVKVDEKLKKFSDQGKEFIDKSLI